MSKNLKVFKVENHPQNPSVILLHGYGANGKDLMGLAHYPPLQKLDYNWYFLEAPLSPPELALFGGKAWFNITLSSFGPDMSKDTLEKFYTLENKEFSTSLELIKNTIWDLGLTQKKWIGGFSQGAMMAVNTFIKDQDEYEGLIAFSGVPLGHSRWPKASSLKKVFISHGKQDPVLPFQAGEKLKNSLENLNFDVESHWFDGGHEISPQVLNKLSLFLTNLN